MDKFNILNFPMKTTKGERIELAGDLVYHIGVETRKSYRNV